MLSEIEMITENVEEEIPVVIIKIFKIQSCVHGFHFFQDSWQPKLGEFLNANNEEKPSSLIHDGMAMMIGKLFRVKIKMEKLLGMFLNMCGSKCIFSLNTVKKWK